jgi:hypothetical protein
MQHPHLNNIASYLSLCEEVFDIAGATVAELVNETNALYGGRAISASRILWVNGVPYIYIYIYIYILFFIFYYAPYTEAVPYLPPAFFGSMCLTCVSIWCVCLYGVCGYVPCVCACMLVYPQVSQKKNIKFKHTFSSLYSHGSLVYSQV